MSVNRHLTAAALALTAALALAGCSTSSGSGDDGRIPVVASTNVYGGIVAAIGGSRVQVTSILSNPSQDPHSFEASARTQLAVSRAKLLVENGGGYDDFMHTLRNSTHSTAPVIDVVQLSGLRSEDADFNEHVFYRYPTMVTFVASVTKRLAAEDPSHAAGFRSRAATLTKQLQHLEDETAALKTRYDGRRVAYTEPVPGYLFDAIGLTNATPAGFSHAIEEGDDVPPAALDATLALFSGNDPVRLLAYNEQTSSTETEQVKAAAKQHDVPVVGVTETLPAGDDYVQWQQANIDAISTALAH